MSEVNINISKKVFNKGFLQYLDNDKRYLVFYGGAGSGKSFFVAQRYLYKLLKSKKFNLLVVRATGKSNRDSTFALFKQVINKWKLGEHFKINESDLRIKCLLNDNEIIFSGLDDVEKLKSVTFSKGELTDIWIEEASEVLEADFNQLDVRLRGKGTKKQIVISFNPIDINHWLKKRFFDRQDDNIEISHSTYKNNDFLDDDYKRLLESYRETDPYYYDVYCLGKWGVVGKSVFDARAIQERLDKIPKPIKKGFFTYDYDGLRISNIRFVNSNEGYINIYQVPDSPEITNYCIGGDTAGATGEDWFTADVLDARTGIQVASMRLQCDPDEYAKQIYCLAKYYKDALVCIEANFDAHPIIELQRLGYEKQYVRTKLDSYTGKTEKSFGFRTTSLTRPTIISNLIQIVRDHTDTINDRETLEELLTIIRNEKGRIEAPEGGHDDQMMSLAIAHEAINQVVFDREPISIRQEFGFKFQQQNQWNRDYGEKITIV